MNQTDKKIVKEKDINIRVGLNEKNQVIKMAWRASDSEFEQYKAIKALILSLWDAKENNSMRIELWHKEFTLEEMYSFVYQTTLSLSDTLQKATGDEEAANEMKDFAVHFARKTGLIK